MEKKSWRPRFLFFISFLVFPGLLGGAMALAAWGISRLPSDRYSLALPAILWLSMGLLHVLERIMPYRKEWNRSHGDIAADLFHTVFSFTLTAKLVEALLWGGLLGLSVKLSQTVGFALWPGHWSLPWQLALSLALSELGLYAIHRLAHVNPWLWRLHALHHSAPRLYWLNAGRFHPLDVAVQAIPGMLPLVLLGAPAPVLFLHWTFTGVHGLLQHCNVAMRLGPFSQVFSTAELHRWHHSRKLSEANHNYGKVFILFDLVFGTRHLPKGEVGELGLELEAFPEGIWGHLLSPFAWNGFAAGKHSLPAGGGRPNPGP